MSIAAEKIVESIREGAGASAIEEAITETLKERALGQINAIRESVLAEAGFVKAVVEAEEDEEDEDEGKEKEGDDSEDEDKSDEDKDE